jgi:proton glutamate symport protein
MVELIKRWWLSPWLILISMVVGTLIGVKYETLAATLAPFGHLYLTLLQMCVLPIMITAIIAGLGNLLRSGKAGRYLKRMLGVYVLGLAVVATITLGISLTLNIGKHLSEKDKTAISIQLAKAEHTTKVLVAEQEEVKHDNKIVSFLGSIIPANVFAAMTKGQNLAVLFFCLALGLALGKSKAEGAMTTLKVVDSATDALLIVVGWTMYGLPIGLCCLLAGYVAQTGLAILAILFKLILLYCLMGVVLSLICSLIIWRRSGQPYLQCWLALKEPLMIAFSTRSSFAAMPATLKGLHEKLGMDKKSTDLLIPVGFMLNPIGSVMHYCLLAVFLCQLYGMPFGTEQFLISIVTSIAASIAVTGIPSIAALGIMTVVLNPLGLPIDVGIMLAAAVDTVADMIMTILNVHGNCAAATLIVDKGNSV